MVAARSWLPFLLAIATFVPYRDARAEGGADVPVKIPPTPIGLSNIVVRVADGYQIGLVRPELRVVLLERLRQRGFHGVGAENLVFDKDESHRALFRLGGIVQEIDCTKKGALLRCRVGIEWQLLDVERDQVVYRATTRAAVLDVLETDRAQMASRLLVGALDSLLSRPKLRTALAAGPAPVAPDEAFPPAKFASCAPSAKKMPEAAEDVLGATVLLKTASGFGSGFFLTADGLVLTAAHVVENGAPRLRMRDGTEMVATPLRVAERQDVALLRVPSPSSPTRCLAVSSSAPAVGTEVYAAGAPADVSLAFSLTRGIVSGERARDGQRLLQTDTPVSPGNSGGPLVDATAAAVAVVTSKLSGARVEGVAFGAPMADALRALGISPGATTDPSLLTGGEAKPRPVSEARAIVDTPDPTPSLDPEADAASERAKDEEARRAERDKRTPVYVDVLLWGGVAVAGLGLSAAIVSYAGYDSAKTTQSQFKTLELYNTVGWVGVALGGGATITGLVLRPAMAPSGTAASVSIGPSGLSYQGSFQ